MLAAYMLFMAKPGVGPLYLWAWLLVVYAGFSIATLSQLAWGGGALAPLRPAIPHLRLVAGGQRGGHGPGPGHSRRSCRCMGVEATTARAWRAMGWFIVIC